MQRIRALVQQQRVFSTCQLAGFMLISAALAIVQHPASISMTWFNTLTDVSIPPLAWATWFFLSGWILAWQQRADSQRFFLLTTPILGYSTLNWVFFFTNENASSTPAVLILCLFIALQFAHERQEAWAKWMKTSATS